MAESGDQLLREIDEDLRREQWLKLWRAWGRYVVAVAAVLVIAVVAWLGWREWRQGELAADGQAYWLADRLELLGDRAGSAEAFGALAEEGNEGYRLLARLRQGQALAVTGDTEGAVAAYDAVAADTSIAPAYRQLGDLYAVMLLLDGGDPEQLSARLAPLAAAGSPWRHSAIELQGLLAMKAGDHAAAAGHFESLLADPLTPTTLRARAAELLVMAGGSS